MPKNIINITAIFAVSLFSLPLHSFAQEYAYVSDILVVNFRTGQGNEFRIDKRLKSGTQVTVLEKSEDNRWSKVALSDGQEGWVLSQYLQNEPVAADRLAQSLTQIARLEKAVQQLQQKNTDLTKNYSTANQSAQTSAKSLEDATAELNRIKSISANALSLDERYRELLQKHQLIQTERDSLLAENENLKGDQKISFMMYGAGLIIVGVILAMIIPLLKPKKRFSEWS